MTPLTVSTVVVCLLIYCCAVHTQSSFIETDSIVFPETENDTTPSNPFDISEKLKECITDNSKIEFNGECRSLLTTEGACPEGEWLVLDLLSASLPQLKIQGKCATRRCEPKQHYWLDQRRCVYPNESSSLCPQGNTISTDYFGDGFCECIKEPIHARERRSGRCYQVFTRGPCVNGSVWVGERGRMNCCKDSCASTRGRFPAKTIVPWQNGVCYAINERGPCVQGNVIRINTLSLQPECGDPLTPLNLFNPPSTCTGTDHSGKCTRPVTIPQNIQNFYSNVADQASKKRAKKGLNSPK
uniref:DUF4789 domain-containing protein n=1 Tax=Graphocephala atropunctata TaxID=36148 RepID=A0A1B6MCM0_9HEMI